jgi:hypothetical protein
MFISRLFALVLHVQMGPPGSKGSKGSGKGSIMTQSASANRLHDGCGRSIRLLSNMDTEGSLGSGTVKAPDTYTCLEVEHRPCHLHATERTKLTYIWSSRNLLRKFSTMAFSCIFESSTMSSTPLVFTDLLCQW